MMKSIILQRSFISSLNCTVQLILKPQLTSQFNNIKNKFMLKGTEIMTLECVWRNFVERPVAQGLYSGGTANSDRLNFFIIQQN